METDNIVIGKINKKKCYLNNGKYGYYLNHDGKNYKVPEWFPVDKFDVDIAERLIEYKKKMSEMYCDDSAKKTKPTKQDESESEEEKFDKPLVGDLARDNFWKLYKSDRKFKDFN